MKRRAPKFDVQAWQDKCADEIVRKYSEEDLVRVWAQLERTKHMVGLAIIKAREKKNNDTKSAPV